MMSLIVHTNLVLFEVPTFDHFVFSAREHVSGSGAHSESSHARNVAGKCELQTVWSAGRAFRQVPHLREYTMTIARAREM
jgi:hypothetical protein